MVPSVFVTCVVVAALTVGSHGYRGGSGRSACRSMRVGHGSLQRGPSPYSLSLSESPTTYTAGNQVKVCIGASEVWRGILLQARRVGDVVPVGTWSSDLPQNTRLMRCSSAGDSVTHANTASKHDNSCFLWNPPSKPAGDIFFVATVAASKNVWWMDHTTKTLLPEAKYGTRTTAVPSSVTPGSSTVHIPRVTPRSGGNGGRGDYDSSEEDYDGDSSEEDYDSNEEHDDSNEEQKENSSREGGSRETEQNGGDSRDGQEDNHRKPHGDRKPDNDRKPHGNRRPHNGTMQHGGRRPYNGTMKHGDRRPYNGTMKHGDRQTHNGTVQQGDRRPYNGTMQHGNRQPDDDWKPHGDRRPHNNSVTHGDRPAGDDTLPQGDKPTGSDSHSYSDDGLNGLSEKQFSSSSVVSHSMALLTATFAALRFFH